MNPQTQIRRRTTREDVEHLVTIDVAHETRPNFADLIGDGRGKAYAMVRDGEVPHVDAGRRVLIPVRPMLAWLDDAAGPTA